MILDTLMSDMTDQGETLDDNGQAILEVDTELGQAVIVWREPLAFHGEYNGPQGPDGYGAGERDNWSRFTGAGGWLTADARRSLVKRLITTLPGAPTVYSGTDDRMEEPNVVFEIVTAYQAGETFGHWMDRIGYPIVATLINVTDPGTFGSPYLFDMGSL